MKFKGRYSYKLSCVLHDAQSTHQCLNVGIPQCPQGYRPFQHSLAKNLKILTRMIQAANETFFSAFILHKNAFL